MDNFLTKLYQTYGFPAKERLYRLAKAIRPDIRRDDVNDFLDGQQTYQLHRKKIKNNPTPITTGKEQEQYQMDLLDMSKFWHANGGNRWILICIDIFTRKAAAQPLKDKKAETTLKGLKEILKELGKPRLIVSDSGSEFKGAVSKYLKDNGILHRVTEPMDHNVLGIIDRFSMAIKNMIYKHFTFYDTTKWTDALPVFIEIYNNSIHSTLDGMTPNEALKYPSDTRAIHAQRTLESRPVKKLQVGDTVKVKLKKNVFSKGYTINWSTKNYIIDSINGLNYTLNDGNTYRADGLQKVKPSLIPEKEDIVKVAHKQHRVNQVLKSNSIDQNNRRVGSRERKPNKNLDYVY
jgi:transposase InsO family protein